MTLVFLIIIFLLWYYYKKHKSVTKRPNEYSFLLTLNNPPVTIDQIKIGDSFNPWLKPNSNQVNIYYPGYYLGEGFIGLIYSDELYNFLNSNQNIVDNKVSKINGNRIFLTFDIHAPDTLNNDTYITDNIQSFKDNLLKSYKPKKSIFLLFTINSITKFPKNIMVKNVPQENFFERIFYGGKYELLKNSIWLEDENGNRISNENKSSYDSLLRYYKAIFTGCKMYWTIKTKIPHNLSKKFLSSAIEIEVHFNDSDI